MVLHRHKWPVPFAAVLPDQIDDLGIFILGVKLCGLRMPFSYGDFSELIGLPGASVAR